MTTLRKSTRLILAQAIRDWLSSNSNKVNFAISEGTVFFGYHRVSFFCQIDQQNHPATDPAYQCSDCSRLVCNSCYEAQTGIFGCPYCKGKLRKIQ
ncbi:MAG: hypothetical protein ACFFB5_23645 [Promethearchaeota archaeon]